jgi:hypothetical protein
MGSPRMLAPRALGEERASLQAAGDRGGRPLDRALALLGLAAELAVDDGAAQAAFAWLLVGSTPSVWAKVQRRPAPAGSWRTADGTSSGPCGPRARAGFGFACAARPGPGDERGRRPAGRRANVGRSRDLESSPNLICSAMPRCGQEVAKQVRPAKLSLAGIEVVVAAPAIRADDPGEALAEQRPASKAAAGRDPEDCGPGGQGARNVCRGGFPARLSC